MKLSVVIPCYNEVATIDRILAAVHASPHRDKEVIVVDDCSVDGTRERLTGELRGSIEMRQRAGGGTEAVVVVPLNARR